MNNYIELILNYLKHLRDWCFRTPTRMVELISGIGAFIFASAFLLDFVIFAVTHPLRHITFLSSKWLWLVMLCLSVMQIVYACRNTLRSNVKSAYVQLWFALVWSLAAVMFATDFPPLSIGFYTYIMLAIVNLISYLYLDHLNKSKTKELNGNG